MPKDSQICLATIDDHLLDGLDFCRKVYDLFDQIKRQPDGKRRLALRKSTADKRFVEELLPLARYIQVRYQAGRRIKVRWLSGSQPYDAVLWFSGSLVDLGDAPRKVFVEITNSVHPNDHLMRTKLHEHGSSFGVKGIHREGKEIVSEPYVLCGGENAEDLAQQILRCIDNKAEKPYPPSTVLIVNCIPNSLMFEGEWTDAVEQVRKAEPIAFREVFLLDLRGSHSATLYGHRKRSLRPESQKQQ
jgi:hypothetical protein